MMDSSAPSGNWLANADVHIYARATQEEEKRLRSYDTLFEESKMASNADVAASEDASASIAYEDDFMVREGGHMVQRS